MRVALALAVTLLFAGFVLIFVDEMSGRDTDVLAGLALVSILAGVGVLSWCGLWALWTWAV